MENVVYNEDGTPSIRSHDCITQKGFAEIVTEVSSHPGCKLTNQNLSSRGITVDMSCTTSKYQLNSHGVIDFLNTSYTSSIPVAAMERAGVLDSEHVRGTQTLNMVVPWSFK